MFGFHLDCLDLTGGETVGFFKKNGVEAEKRGNRAPMVARRVLRIAALAGVVELADTGDLKSPAP